MKRRLWIAVVMACTACEKGMHNMYDQPRFQTYNETPLFDDERAEQYPPPDTEVYSRGVLAGTSAGRVGVEEQGTERRDLDAPSNPYPMTMKLLERGRNRYDIYCTPCHGRVGDGQGVVAQRGFPTPPNLHTEALRELSDRKMFDAISNGYGVMYSYRERISIADRWAIVAYMRALQLSQHAPLDRLGAADRERLGSAQ